MNYFASIAPQTFGHLLGGFNWHKPKAKRLFVIWSLMVFPSLISCLFLVGIPATFFSVYFAHRSWRRWRSSQNVVLLYEHGLVDQRKPQPVILPYSDVDTLLIAITRLANVTSYVHTIQTKDNRKIQLDEHLAQIKDLGQILQEQIAQQQLPEAIATYNQGQSVSFKQLAISPDGISMGKQHLIWQDFDSAAVIQSRTRKHLHVFIEIKQKGQQKPWALLNQATFPNLSLFFALLSHIQNSTQPYNI
ncbi:MAG: hypothetical protein F6K28_48665 [Microcoleus sp. SIO2G3]|nr:hypothetical protein [Microcoleus sp. SIO2G3]